MTTIPKITLTDNDDYCTVLAKGFDGFKEVFNFPFPRGTVERLDALKAQAQAKTSASGKEPYTIVFGGEVMQIRPCGTQSAAWIIEDDSLRFFIRHPGGVNAEKVMEWAISVEYSAQGLWGEGIDFLREKALAIVMHEMNVPKDYIKEKEEKDWRRVSMFHFAFDFLSPRLSADINPMFWGNLIAPAKVAKSMHGGGKVQTLTIGSKDSLQVQLYNKGKEITAKSGKTWMFKVWGENGYIKPADGKETNVWRLELRFYKAFLKGRGLRTADDVFESLPELLAEALITRRLTVPSHTDDNRWRWPLHPIWSEAYRQAGEALRFIARGYYTDMSGEAMEHCLLANTAGNLRSLGVLLGGDGSPDEWPEMIEKIMELAAQDDEFEEKAARARERYMHIKFADEGRNKPLPAFDEVAYWCSQGRKQAEIRRNRELRMR